VKPRKTHWRRTSKLQTAILGVIRARKRCSIGDIRIALGIAPRRNSPLYNSVEVLVQRGLVVRCRKPVRARDRQLRLPTWQETIVKSFREAYLRYPQSWPRLFTKSG
jgi:DNA-binding MarR family transcriptional regulator